LVGTGPLMQELNKIIATNKLNGFVYLLGQRSDALEITRRAWAVVNSSRWEGMPFTLIDSCMLGKTVVATPVNGNKDLIKNGLTGMLFPVEAPSICAELLKKLASDKSLHTTLGIAAKKMAQTQFSVEAMANEHARIYNELGAK
jgi:glycosyltransferase involved in cell wall biosynthesis